MRSTSEEAELTSWLEGVHTLIRAPLNNKSEDRARLVSCLAPTSAHQIAVECVDTKRLNFEVSRFGETLQVAWPNMEAVLTELLPLQEYGKPPLRLVVDLTDKDWEYCFFVLPHLFKRRDLQITCAFTAPARYPQSKRDYEHPPIETYGIRQPPGFIAGFDSVTSPTEEHSDHHVFFLGFDADRARKFIENYNWIRSNCIAVIGDPPYVSGGRELCKKANRSLLVEIPEKDFNWRKVPASNPFETRDLLLQLFDISLRLDIILLGTSPMTLGATLFYLGLPRQLRTRIRFLHDFPKRHPGRTEGVRQTWLYDCF